MEKRGLHRALDTFEEVEGIMPDRRREIIGYMDGTKSTLPGLNKNIPYVKKAQMWSGNPQVGQPSDRHSGASREHQFPTHLPKLSVVVNNKLVPANLYLCR